MNAAEFRAARFALGLSTGGMARLIRIERRSVIRLESGEREVSDTLALLVELLLALPQARALADAKAPLKGEGRDAASEPAPRAGRPRGAGRG